ncbi:MAG: FprA family A-type flavoprotein [Lachnospiraceae bacterium]|nr:FprA family A-type flavoprotein [Lachnospiraceae bacterium]
MNITKDVVYAGVDDKDIELFESQYAVPDGVSYNSYVIFDDKVTVMDTVDGRKTKEWLEGLKEILGEKKPHYLVVSHVEPDHAGSVAAFLEAYPETEVVGNAKTFQFLLQFFPELEEKMRKIVVSEGETLSLGSHTLQFFMAPMVHWPEVMVTYEQSEKILFSADAFGKFGTFDRKDDWVCEARRYYINIVGKYGAMVQMLLKKAAKLDIQIICPLHGPVLNENLSYYIEKYDIWSSYRAEDCGVLIAYASIHGHTARAAEILAELLKEKGEKTEIFDLARNDMSEAVEGAFRYDRMVLLSATYDGGLFPCMEDFLAHLKNKAYQKRTVALIENGSWAPMAAKCMRQMLDSMKEITVLEDVISIKSALNERNMDALKQLAENL